MGVAEVSPAMPASVHQERPVLQRRHVDGFPWGSLNGRPIIRVCFLRVCAWRLNGIGSP